MTPSETALLVGAGCFGSHLLLTLLLLRLPGRVAPVARHAGSAAFTHVAGVVFAAITLGPIPYWPIAAVSGFGAVGWLFAFSAVYKSVSLRILSHLAEAPRSAIPFEEVTACFVLPEFQSRVKVLEAMGCAEAITEGYALTEKGGATARRILAVQWVCGIERSGLYGGVEESLAERQAA